MAKQLHNNVWVPTVRPTGFVLFPFPISHYLVV